MKLELINSIACGMIALWAFWCVVSGKVRDGILGKLNLLGYRHQRVRGHYPA